MSTNSINAAVNNKPGALYYRVRGSGESLLLIHGMGSSGVDWESQIRAMQRHFRVIVPDLPGCGHSPAFAGGFSISDCATVLCLLAWFTDRPSRASRRWGCHTPPVSARVAHVMRVVERQTALNRLEFSA